jgi:hypothetical protein
MGHQFYARLTGEYVAVLQAELERDDVDVARAADAAAKAAHSRVAKLIAAGDIHRICKALRDVLQLLRGTDPFDNGVFTAKAEALRNLKWTCKYPSEAAQVATLVMSDPRAPALTSSGLLELVFQSAATYCAEQIVRSEAVYRLPSTGFLSTEFLVSDLVSTTAETAFKQAKANHERNPRGYLGKKDRWRQPRSKAPRRKQSEIDNDDVSA